MSEEITIIEQTSSEVYQQEERAIIDSQIATAKQYPRDIIRSVNNSVAIATMDKDTAETCNYSLPRGGKTISGPSVHLARILAQNWGNLRVESKVISTSGNTIVSQAVCHDLETNYAVKVEVRKSIMQNVWENGRKTGAMARMNDDMIVVTGNAANSIAYRNAIYQVIPKSVVSKVYQATKNLITGDITDEEALIKRRKGMLDFFKNDYNVTESQILEVLNLNSINQIKQDEIITLIGLVQSIKDGDTTVAETFGTTKKVSGDNAKKQSESIKEKLKGKQPDKEPEAAIDPKLNNLKVKSLEDARSILKNDFGANTDGIDDKSTVEMAISMGFNLVMPV